MHHPIVAHDKRDTDPNAVMADSPFWAWLEENQYSVYSVAILRYLGIENLPRELRFGTFTREEIDNYRHIHQHFWWTKLRPARRKWLREHNIL